MISFIIFLFIKKEEPTTLERNASDKMMLFVWNIIR
jgi:hypothetical protein